MYGLSMDIVPTYHLSSFRYFAPNEKHITRTFPIDVLIIMISGTLKFTENGIPVEVSAGEYYIQEGGLSQHGHVASDLPSYFYVHFNGKWDTKGSIIPRRGKYNANEMIPLIKKLDAKQKNNSTIIEKSALLLEILSILYQNTISQNGFNVVNSLVLKLTADLKNPPSLNELAKQTFLSREYVIRLFKKVLGITPHQYLTLARINQAKILFDTTDATAEQIGTECGFVDYPHFYRIFKQITRLTPKEYRNNKNHDV